MCSPADLRPAFSLAVVAEINHECVDLKRNAQNSDVPQEYSSIKAK